MRRTGNGYEGLKIFLRILNHPLPMTKNNYGKITKCMHKTVKDVTGTIMQEACQELRVNLTGIINTAVSVDGTWQKRGGFTSLNGAVIAISIPSGKILDCEVMSRFCQGCVYIEKFKVTDPDLYQRYKNDHEYSINHEGSACKMETSGKDI